MGGGVALWRHIWSQSPEQGGSAGSLRPVPPPTPPRTPGREGGRTEFPSAGALAYPASQQALSVYGEKGEMEKAGRRLASTAPPRGRFRRRESGARSARVPPRPIARSPATAASPRESQHALFRQGSHPLSTEPGLRAGTRDTQVTGFGCLGCVSGAPLLGARGFPL